MNYPYLREANLYQEAMKALWFELEQQGLAPFPFPGFGSSSSAGKFPNRALFPDVSLLGLALDCSLSGRSALIERDDGSCFLIYGTDALEGWRSVEAFIQWPFIPLAVDTEAYTVGLALGEGQSCALACAGKDGLYDAVPPQCPDQYDVIAGGIEALPLAMKRIVMEDEEMILFDAF